MPEPGRAQALGLPHVDLIRRSGRPGPGLSCAPRTGPFTLPLLRSRWRIPRKQARHLPSSSHVLAWDAHRELYIPTVEAPGEGVAVGAEGEGVAVGADVLIISKRLSPTTLPM